MIYLNAPTGTSATGNNMCDCKTCQYGREVKRHLENIKDEEAKAFFYDMYENVMHLELDLAFEKGRNEDLRLLNLIN